jgi:anhydro-N-acetylmuramic acid kinase
MALIIGMNSGSSFDGCDVMLAETSIGTDGLPTKPKFIDGMSYDWPEEIQKRVRLAYFDKCGIFELTRINYYVGAFFAQCAQKMMDKHNLKPEDVEVIGLDGITIYQEPPFYDKFKDVDDPVDWIPRWLDGPYARITVAGEPGVIATYTGVPTVNNFRPSDHALGGTGAPTHQFLDFVTFRDISPVITLNIGGISNIHVINRDRATVMGFDTGPGNLMVNYAAEKWLNKPYDKDGAFGAKGTENKELLEDMKKHPTLLRKPPRSFWNYDFGFEFAEGMMQKYSHLSKEDIMATFAAFTGDCIARAITTWVPDYEKYPTLIASGGGVFNPTIMKYLKEKLPPHMTLKLSDDYGIPATYKECVLFAMLGYTCLHQIGNNIPHASGASDFTIMGHLVWPPRFAKATKVI